MYVSFSLPCSGYGVTPGGKEAEAWPQSPTHSAEAKDKVELHIYAPLCLFGRF